MRTTVQLLAVLLAILYCSLAHAATDPYEAMEVTPAEGYVTSLQHFTITFGDLPVVVNENAVPTLQKGGGATLEGHMSLDSDGKTVIIDFDESCTASGQYFLNLPENSLTVNGQRLLPITLRFLIGGDETSFYEQISVNPAEGTVESLQNFTISFPEYIGEIAEGCKATLKHLKSGTTYQAEMYEVGYNVLVYFPDEITRPGQYTLTIPAGAVVIYTLGFEVDELNFNYTIEGDDQESFYDLITIDPAEGTVASLQDFTITFPETVDGITTGSKAKLTNTITGATVQMRMSASGHNVTVNFPNEVDEPGVYRLTIPAGSLIVNALDEEVAELNFHYTIKSQDSTEYTITPAEGEVYLLQNFSISYGSPVEVNEDATPQLVDDQTGRSFECHILEIGGSAYIYMEYPLSVLGNYTLHVPAACIEVLATGAVNPEMTFHYTIVEKQTYVPDVIEDQPDGELHLYQRSGKVIREVEKENVPEGEWPYEIITESQEGSLSIVFAEGNKVYIQRPVSWSYYNGWVEGTLSADGKTITVPLGQSIAYTYSLEMAVQVAMFTYDAEQGSYFYNPDIQEVTYTINDDGTISLNGTDELNILGTMNRAFGQTFQYLDYEWLQDGDYESVYIPISETPLTPPEDMATEFYHFTTAINDGMEWEPYSAVVRVGFDGEDMWMQGICSYLPKAWIKGHIEGNTVTFPNSQLLGSYEVLLYFKAADFNPITGNTTQKDMVLTFDGENTLYTYDYVFISVDKNNLSYLNYYQGLTLSKNPDAQVVVPEGLKTYDYTIQFKTTDEYGSMISQERTVSVGFAGEHVFIQGMCDFLPESWVEGRLENGQLVLDLPQYMGNYDEEYQISYPIFLNGFSQQTGLLNRQVVLDYAPETRVFSNQSTPFGFGINKTGYLNVMDFYEAVLTPVQTFLTGDVNEDGDVNISDVIDLINYILNGDAEGLNLAAGDVDYNGLCNISDVIGLINIVLNS